MTGRIFYWNMTTVRKAGLEDYQKTLEDLYNAGETFKTVMGEDEQVRKK